MMFKDEESGFVFPSDCGSGKVLLKLPVVIFKQQSAVHLKVNQSSVINALEVKVIALFVPSILLKIKVEIQLHLTSVCTYFSPRMFNNTSTRGCYCQVHELKNSIK